MPDVSEIQHATLELDCQAWLDEGVCVPGEVSNRSTFYSMRNVKHRVCEIAFVSSLKTVRRRRALPCTTPQLILTMRLFLAALADAWPFSFPASVYP